MKTLIPALFAAGFLAGCQNSAVFVERVASVERAGPGAAVRQVLEVQQVAWNEGDIDAFMGGYWKSEDLRFASGDTVTKGWQATIDRYKTRYQDRAAMGQLMFSGLDVQMLGDDSAIVHGHWVLERETDRPSGLFTLVFRQFGSNWLIVSDTTTSAD